MKQHEHLLTREVGGGYSTFPMQDPLALSLIIPFYNEEPNLVDLYERITRALDPMGLAYEMVFIDDGSHDHGSDLVRMLAEKDFRVKFIRFYRNYGQTAAISAGIKHAKGEVLVPIDADNQNDPADIPRLLDKMKEGYDVVSGWRKNRHDHFWTRRLPSNIANALISKVTGVHLKDYGCTLKAYKAKYLKSVNLYGEMHRFIPAYASLVGAKVVEIPVGHAPRTKGTSKYGLSRIFKVMLDLLTIKFLGGFATKPLYLFGGIGFVLLAIAAFFSVWVLIDKYLYGIYAHNNPLLLLSIFFTVIAVMLVMMGLLAELLVRIYHESQGKDIYLIRESIHIEE